MKGERVPTRRRTTTDRPSPVSRARPGTGAVAVDVSVLGPCRVEAAGRPVVLRPRERDVLAGLVLAAPGAVSADGLAALVWAEPPSTARKSIHNHVARLRQAVGADAVQTVEGGYRLDPAVATDVARVRRTLDRDGGTDDPDGRSAELAALLEAWRGEAYADLPPTEPVAARRAELAEQRIQLEEQLAGSLIGAGDDGRAVALLERLTVEEPFREGRWWLYALALYRAGQRRDSLQALARARQVLADGVGLDPGHDLRALESRILADDPILMAGPGPMVAERAVRSGIANAIVRSTAFVGRTEELALLGARWKEVHSGGDRRVVVIEGEPGAGKTRLAVEAAMAAERGGATVLWGRSRAAAGLPYGTVVEALGRVLTTVPGVFDRVGPQAAALASVLPDLEGRFPSPVPGPGNEVGRARLFQVISSVFASVTETPTVWIVDDLQWAPEDSLALLEQVLTAMAGRPLLVVATVRRGTDKVAATLADWQRTFSAETVSLGGLEVDDLTALLGARLPEEEAVPELAAVMHERTGGNAFFVTELLAADVEPGSPFDPSGVPTTVRTWLRRRRDALPPAAADVLGLASVLGFEVDIDLLRAADDGDARALLDACDFLLEERFLKPHLPGNLRFAHALVRDVVYEGLSEMRRTWLHQQVAEALEGRTPQPSVLLAHHWSQAGPSFDWPTHRAAMDAARSALGKSAWTSAVGHAELAYGRAHDADGTAAALIARGRAERALGRLGAARASLEEAVDLAREAGLGRRRAEAILALVGGGGRGAAIELADGDRARLLEEALDGLGEEDEELLVPVLSELALALLLTDRREEREHLARRAVAVARTSSTPSHLAGALLSRRLLGMGPVEAATRLADLDEVLSLPEADRPAEATLAALMARHEDLLLVGERAGARAALAEATGRAEDFGHPYWSWVTAAWQGLDAVIDGRLDDAEAQAFAALAVQPDHPEALACLGVNLVDIRLYQGRAGEVLDLLSEAADDNPHIPAYRAVLALCCVEAGDPSRAEAPYRHFAERRFGNVPDDTNRLLALSALARVAGTIGRPHERGDLSALLAPWDGCQALLNCFAGGGAYWGPVAHSLAVLEEPGRRRSRLLDEAEASATAFGAPLAVGRIVADR